MLCEARHSTTLWERRRPWSANMRTIGSEEIMQMNAPCNVGGRRQRRRDGTLKRAAIGVLIACVGVAGMTAGAATWTWTGGASPDATWSNPGNWDAGSAPANGCDLVFPAGPSSKAPVNDIAQGTLSSINSVTIADAGYDVTSTSASTLTIANGFVNSSSSGVANWRIKLSLPQAQTFSTTSASASTAFFGTWNLNSYTLTISGSGDMDNTAVISGTGGIIKNGAGNLGLANLGNNIYTGKTTVNGGTVFVIQESNLGANPASLAADQLKLDGGTLQAGLDFTIDDSNRGITLGAGGGTISADFEKTLTIAKIIAGTGNLTKVGPGTVKLTIATSTYSGKTIINDGTLGINAEARLGAGTGTFVPDLLTIQNGATLNFFGNVTISGTKRGITLGTGGGIISVDDTMVTELKNVITGVGSLTKAGPGSLKLSTAANTYTGKTIANAGTLMIDSETRLGNNPASFTADQLTIQDGATLEAFASFTVDDSNRGMTLDTGAGTILADSGFTLAVAEQIAGAGALQVNGLGTLTLSGASSFSGGTTVSAGVLRVANVSGSATGTGAVGVGAGATLSGNGRVGGAVTVADNATAVLYPNSSGTLTAGDNIIVDATSTIEFNLGSSAASGNDKVVLENQTLTITGSPQITINSAGLLDTADYVLFNAGASGAISGSFNPTPIWAGTTPALAARYSVVTVGNTVVLHYTAISLTVTAASNTKTYDGTTSALATPTITSGTLDSGDTGVFTESYNDHNFGSSKTLTPAGTIRDSGSADVTSRYTITWTAANSGTITAATLTYTATGVHRNYGLANPTFSGSISGFASGDNQGNATSGTLTFTSSATTGTGAGSYAINGSGLTANNGNYTFVQAGGNATALTVDPLPVTLSGSRIYNRLATATASILTIGNNLDGANLTLSGTANLASKNVGTRAISAGTLALGGMAAGNYTLSGLSGSVTITTKDARLTGLSASDKFYDGTTTATLTGTSTLTSGDVVSGDDVSLVSGSTPTGAFVDRELGSAKSVPYSSVFSLSGADASNYNLVLPSLTASILNHKEDSGTTTNTSANSLTFGLSLNNGKLLADNDPASGSINGAGMITVNATSILGGTGKVGGVTVNGGGTLAPGDTVGTLSTSSETWNTNGAYALQMSSATGTGGSDWDLVSITGNLTIAATITNAFTVQVNTLSGGAPGQAANFNNTLAYQWPIATVTGSIIGFDATKFIVDASQFQNATGSGKFSVKLSSDQKSVNLVFTPSCAVNLTTSTYVLGTDGKVHMYFSNPFGFNTAGGLEARILNNCTITLAMAYGPGFESGQSIGGLPLTVVGQSTSISAGATRLEVVATKINGSQSSTVNVEVRDACGGQGNFDPVFTELKVQQGGVVRQSFSNLPAAEHYVGVVNGTPGLAWLSILANGQVFALNPLADGQSVLLDLGAAMGEGNTNVLVLAGQGVAGASASITIGDLSVVTGALTPVAVVTGTEAQHWTSLAMAAENPVLQIATSGGNIVLSWSDMWDGFSVQTRASMAPEASWVPMVVTPVLANGRLTATVPFSSGMCFRLSNP